MIKSYYKPKDYEVKRSIGHLIRSLGAQVSAKVEDLFDDQEISFIQYVILMYLRDGMAKTPAELCQRVRYDSGALTRVLDQLEERKLLTRQRCTEDRRVVKLHITPKGVATAENMMPHVIGLYNHWLEGFTKDEADTLVQLLTRLKTTIATTEKRV